MLNEQIADDSLENVMNMAKDAYLKAKTKEELKEAADRYLALHRIYNDRLKIQNDRYVAEARNEIDLEKMENDKERQIYIDIEDKKSKSKERWMKIAFKAVETGIMVGLSIVEIAIIKHDLIETNAISNATKKGFIGRIGDYMKS